MNSFSIQQQKIIELFQIFVLKLVSQHYDYVFFRLFQQQTMKNIKKNNPYFLVIKSSTWNKDSHSLYDYESNKMQNTSFCFPLTSKPINVYRKRQGSSVVAYSSEQEHKIDLQEYQLLTNFNINQNNAHQKIKLDFMTKGEIKTKEITSQHLKTDQSITSSTTKEQQAYMIIKNFKDNNGQDKGYVLKPGQTIKLGRIEYFITEINCGGVVNTANSIKKNKYNNYNQNILKYDRTENLKTRKEEQIQCKICLQTEDTQQNFLFNPCKCTGSCGTVHYQCLLQWIHFKVKKQVVGGTLHYNFEKFQCQVCKFQLPMIIDVQSSQKQLLPLEKPKMNYMILEAACEKSKSVMIIHNVPLNGIKLGRGHQCEIRITDISVSRTHALIKYINDSFVIFDNKSKFGSLIREEEMSLQLGKGILSVQVGRTVLSFQIKKQKEGKGGEAEQKSLK